MDANVITQLIVDKKIDIQSKTGVYANSVLIPAKEYDEIIYTLSKYYSRYEGSRIYSTGKILGLNIIVSEEVESIQVGYII